MKIETKKEKLAKLKARIFNYKFVIALLLLTNIATNIYLVVSVVQMHAFTMQFVSDVFYYNSTTGTIDPPEDAIVDVQQNDVEHTD